MSTNATQGNPLIGLLILGIFILIFRACLGCGEDAPKKPKTREEQIKECFSAWDGSHRKLERWVKNNMNDPSSYEHIETRYVDNTTSIGIIMKFRGKNAFGGKVVTTVIAQCDNNCEIIGTPQFSSQ